MLFSIKELFLTRSNSRIVLPMICFLCIISVVEASSNGGLVFSNGNCTVWWTGSTYKVMREEIAPLKRGKINICAAKNETESFQLILSPKTDLKNISLTITDFSNSRGMLISNENITLRKVEYVYVSKPSGHNHQKGWYPDPLPSLENPFNIIAGINSPFLFTVKIPKDATFGNYSALISLKTENWETSIPVELKVWDFTLPDNSYMRSGFGLSTGLIKEYHNLDTDEELEQVKEKYYESFKNYKISPYGSYPVKYTVKGVNWSGGTFDPFTVYEGKYSYQVTGQREGNFKKLIEINPSRPYLLKWKAKTLEKNQKYTVTVKCYDGDKRPIYWSLKWIVYEGSEDWREDTLFIDTESFFAFEDLPDYRPFPDNARYASIQIYPYLPGTSCSYGTVWLDNFQFIDLTSGKNLLPEGDFEQDINKLEMELDFSEFNIAARKYLDELGFTGFRTSFPGLRSGPFVGKKTGWFNGFISGTLEYEKLAGIYFKGFQDHLETNGWLGKEYFYWIDEPSHEEYDFVREGMNTIHKVAPKLTRFITENNPGPQIMDVTEIGCPVFYKVEPEKIKEWSKRGRQFWSYLMCWPKEPHVNLFIDSDAINLRIWLWMSYKYNLTGILVWQSNHWHNGSSGAFPEGTLQNIWEDPMSYKSGYGTPFGSAPEFGNGDGMFFYPPNRDPNNDKTKYMTGPVPSLRLEILREGLEDYDYMIMLEKCVENARPNQQNLVKKAQKLLNFGDEIFTDDQVYTKEPEILMNYREQMGALLEKFKKVFKSK